MQDFCENRTQVKLKTNGHEALEAAARCDPRLASGLPRPTWALTATRFALRPSAGAVGAERV